MEIPKYDQDPTPDSEYVRAELIAGLMAAFEAQESLRNAPAASERVQ